jgi:hypothetical protein
VPSHHPADGAIYAVSVAAGHLDGNDSWWLSPWSARKELRDDWPGREVRTAVVIEAPELSGWDGLQRTEAPAEGVRIVTTSNLDDILLGPPASPEATPDARPSRRSDRWDSDPSVQ